MEDGRHLDSPLGDVAVEVEGDAPGEVERAIYKCAPDTTVPIELSEIRLAQEPLTTTAKGALMAALCEV